MALDTIPKQEGGKLKAVASGTLPSGQPVVVNSDGTVSVISETSVSQIIGSGTVFNTGDSSTLQGVYDAASGKVVLAYKDFNNVPRTGEVVIGTVSGTSISFGTPVAFTTAEANWFTVAYDANAQKVVLSYADQANSSYGTAKVGTVSGTTISFGTATVFQSIDINYIRSTYDEISQKVVVIYKNGANSYATGIVGTVSGTSISFGSSTSFATSNSDPKGVTYDANAGKVVVVFRVYATGGEVVVGTVSGTSISFGTSVVFTSAALDYADIVYDASAQKVVVLFADAANSSYGTAKVGTVSGTSITLGSSVVIATIAFSTFYGSYNAAAQKVIVTYKDSSDANRGKFVTGTVSGASISFDTAVVFNTASTPDGSFPLYDPDAEKIVIAYRDASLSNYGTAKVVQNAYTSTNLTSENYIGMSGGVAFQTGSPASAGSPAVFVSGETRYQKAIFDSNSNKVVVAYRNDSSGDSGFAVVGTVSGTSISFGTPVQFNGGGTNEIAITFDSNSNKVVIAYQDGANANTGTAIVGTVSGTSISFGTEVSFNGSTNDTAIAFDSSSNKVVVAYQDNTNSGYGTAKVGTVSGTSISFGTATVFQSANMEWPSLAFDSSNNKMVIGCGSGTGKAYVGTVSGTSISFGSVVTFESGSGVQETSNVFDSNSDKIVIAYRDGANSGYGTAIVGTVSGTSISFGTKVVFDENDSDFMGATFDSNVNKVVIAYRDRGSSDYGTVISGTVSGTSIAFDASLVYEQAASLYNSPTFDSNSNKVVIAYRDNGNSSYGTGIVITPDTLAVTRGQVADGDAATVDIVGTVSSNQVGLTAGQQYYVQTDGTIGTTPADPSVLAGTAVSATKMVVKS